MILAAQEAVYAIIFLWMPWGMVVIFTSDSSRSRKVVGNILHQSGCAVHFLKFNKKPCQEEFLYLVNYFLKNM